MKYKKNLNPLVIASMATSNYKDISTIARKRRDALLSSFYDVPSFDDSKLPTNLTAYSLECGYYSTSEIEIIESEAEDILQKIRDRLWTSLEVTEAFCKASALAQQLVGLSRFLIRGHALTQIQTNCVTEVLYPEALERAKYLDEYLAEKGMTIGPLHGLPISLKDCFITAPHPSSIGMAAFANEPLPADTLLVTILRDLGAVFYVKTNVPTAMMMAETQVCTLASIQRFLQWLMVERTTSGVRLAIHFTKG